MKRVSSCFLMEIHDENAKKIIAKGKLYKKAQKERLKFGKKEAELKEELRQLIHELNYAPLEDGVIRLNFEGLIVSIEPRNELVKVTLKDE